MDHRAQERALRPFLFCRGARVPGICRRIQVGGSRGRDHAGGATFCLAILRAFSPSLPLCTAQQDRDLFPSSGVVAGLLVETRSTAVSGHCAFAAVLRNRCGLRTVDRLDGETFCRCSGSSVCAHISGTVSDRRAGALVLCRETYLADAADLYLPALAHQHGYLVAVAVSTRRSRRG